MRRLYDLQKLSLPYSVHYTGQKVNPLHHVKLNEAAYKDLCVWFRFLTFPAHKMDRAVPFLRFLGDVQQGVPELRTDASGAMRLGFGAIFRSHYIYARWPIGFFKQRQPSIALLELLAVVIAHGQT